MTQDFTPEQQTNIVALIKKLNGLDINASIHGIENGPVVTAYMFTLDHSTPISKIMKKSEDFALSLGVDNVIIQRVKDKIAIFIPNKIRQTVDYKDVLFWYLNDEETNKMILPIPLGVDHRGQKSSLDIAACPHLLITGSTNSGKSVFETSILSSLVYRFDSSQLHIYLVDTKGLDLPLFKTLPHVQQCADNVDDFHNMMTVVMLEVRRRLGVLQGASCQNIYQYHKMYGGDISQMPYILVMLDEFGDLIDLDSSNRKADKEKYETTPTVKGWIKTLTQICRAAGVHIIACTQRASVKIIDGDIKTNLPCRISLRVPSRVDSQVILGTGGAENLLGKGDMLVKYPESDSIQRYHGPFVKMSDINELVVNYQQMREVIKPNGK
jgi:DNA segregation ATPase FtsK/SpoIIIE, S-DNA-T family